MTLTEQLKAIKEKATTFKNEGAPSSKYLVFLSGAQEVLLMNFSSIWHNDIREGISNIYTSLTE